MNKREWAQTIITIFILLGVTTVLYLYTSGVRLDRNRGLINPEIEIKTTGMIGAKSIPDGAKVYVDGELITATNDTIPSLDPGEYELEIIKNGFVPWNKRIEVFPELVTDITAVLISESPSFTPLTNTGAKNPRISPTLSNIAFFSKDGTDPGLWVVPLFGGANGINFFRTNPYVVLEDTFYNIYSSGTDIEWAPDETEVLISDVTEEDERYYLVDLNTRVAQSTPSPDIIRNRWQQERLEDRSDFIERLDLDENIKEIALNPDTIWAPDEKKFLYTVDNGTVIDYKVYNMEKPIPVGEKKNTTVFSISKEAQQIPRITWFADSFHLILTYFDEELSEGTVYTIRIDGSNQTEVYKGTLFSDRVYSSPGGDKLIILTSFKSSGQTDLYTVGIR